MPALDSQLPTGTGGRLPGVVAGLAAAFASLLVTGCGDGSPDVEVGPASLQPARDAGPVHLPPGVVATVAGGEITKADVERAIASRARAGSPPEPRVGRSALVRASMPELIRAEATVQRAKTAGVRVSEARVDAALERLRRPFDSLAQWQRFLKRTGQTERQVRHRLRLELLNRRLYARREGAAQGTESPATSVRRLRAVTKCRPGYVVPICSNAPSTTTEATR